MPIVETLAAFLHLLVFVYWLGGDLGAFYASHALTAPGVSAERRLFAAKVVGDIDMAPRSALVLALPTGALLADVNGWITLPAAALVLLFAASLSWLVVVWRLHRAHDAAAGLKRVDGVFRQLTLAGLLAAGAAGLAGAPPMPFFIAVKLLLLAGAVAMGVLIRRVLAPLSPALQGLSGPDAARAERDLALILGKARPLVVIIWILISAAALMGLARPT
ncbi:MAG: hypothetical protein ACK4NP_05250 [Parvularculaceae bacterium]